MFDNLLMGGGMSKTKSMKNALMGKQGALKELARIDADIAAMLERYGAPPDRTLPEGFKTLCRIIIGQQISTLAASAVWARMEAQGFDDSTVTRKASIAKLRKVGLSMMKAEYVKGLAEAVGDGRLNFDHLAGLSGLEASDYLTAFRGVGAWTADNYRLFVLLDMDAWPYNDLALQEGMKILKSLNTRPDGKTMITIGEKWRPHRGAGALMLWHIYARHRHAATITDI